MEDEMDIFLMTVLEAFKHQVVPSWNIPSKSDWIEVNHGPSKKVSVYGRIKERAHLFRKNMILQ